MMNRQSINSLAVFSFLVFASLATNSAGETIKLPLKECYSAGLVLDDNSFEGQCIAADNQSDGSFSPITTPELSPGFYNLHLRLKLSHTVSVYVARLEFNIGVSQGDNSLTQNEYLIVDFEEPNKYQEFIIPFQAKFPSKASINISWKWYARKDEKRPFAQSTAPKLGSNIEAAGEKDETGEEKLRLSDYPFFIALDKAWLDYNGPIGIESVIVDKVRYKPNETADVKVCVKNYATEAKEATLAGYLVRKMDKQQEVFKESLKLSPNSSKNLDFKVKLDDQLWGHEIKCLLLNQKGNKVSQKSEFFTVHTNPWAVAIGCYGINLPYYRAGPNNKNCNNMAQMAKRQYANTIEFVFWAPDDFGDLNPTQTPYWSGQMRHQSGAKSTKGLIDAYHRAGVACSFYALFTVADGKAGYELYRKHPDWFKPAFYDQEHLDRWDRAESLISWPRVTVTSESDEPYMHHAREIANSVTNFGWDSIRYDTDMSIPGMIDNKPYCARIFPKVKELVMKEHPYFQWGYNDALHRKDLSKEPLLEKLFKTKCENGGMIMDEYTNHGIKDHWSYDKFTRRMITFRDLIHPLGGNITYTKMDCEINDYLFHWILPLAVRSHHAFDPQRGNIVYANYNQFCTRYAGYIWDNKATRIKDAENYIDWGENNKKLFKWKDFAYLRNSEPGKQELIMQLVNTPPQKINSYKDNRVPPPIRDLSCTIKVPEGKTIKDVWMATAEPIINQQKVPFSVKDNTLTFNIPKLRFWNMIVIDCDGKGVWK